MHVRILILVLDFTSTDIYATYLVSNIISKNLPFRARFIWVLFPFHVLLPSPIRIILSTTHTLSFIYP